MFRTSYNRSEQLIQKKQVYEQKQTDLRTKLKQEFNQKEFARWHNKSKAFEQKNQVEAALADLRNKSRQQLEARRAKLAALINADQATYFAELDAMQDNPDKIRMKMAERVKTLKEEKEAERREIVKSRLQQRFEQNADELRKVDQDLKEQKAAYERDLQIIERQRLQQQAYEESLIFVQLEQREAEKKRQEELRKKQILQAQLNQHMSILQLQSEMKERQRQKISELTEKQQEMLKEQWRRQKVQEAEREAEKAAAVKAVNQQVILENERLRVQKEEVTRRERAKDKEMIERIVQKQRELSQMERNQKDHEKQSIKKALQGFRDKKGQIVAYQRELDRIIQAERKKREQKQQEQWEKREKARLNLLYQVFDDRQKVVHHHKLTKEEQSKQKEQDRLEVERRLNEYEAERNRLKMQELEKNKLEQKRLLQDIAGKEERKRQILLALQGEQDAATAAQAEYAAKIAARKADGQRQLEQFKANSRIY